MFQSLAKRFVKGYPQTDDPAVQQRLILFSSVLGIVLNILLVGIKILIGTWVGSLAVISDGINNLMDSAGAVVAALGSYLSARPEDEEHPFGHGRYEYLASFIISFFIMYVGVELFRRGIALTRAPQPMEVSPVAVFAMLLSILVKAWMVVYNKYIDKTIQSTLNEGIAKDSFNDILATGGVLVSLLIYAFADRNLDGPAGLVIAVIVLKAGWDLMRDTTNNLLGQEPDDALVQQIETLLLDGKHIKGYHDLIVHDYGRGKLLASVHVEIPRNIGIVEIHDEIDALENRVREKTHVELVIHMDPNYEYKMETKIQKGEDALNEAARLLQEGKLVAFPTETVYGLGANGLDETAVAEIFAAKNRPKDNPLILHIAEKEQLHALAASVPDVAEKLMDAFWPGPLTLIFPATEEIPAVVTGGGDTVAVRMPSHPIAQEIIRRADRPIAAPSANTSGAPSPTDARAVFSDLAGRIPLIVDGGETGIGLESTVLDITVQPPALLRPGFVTPEDIEGVIGPIRAEKPAADDTTAPRSPGQKYRHYAPEAELILYEELPAMRKEVKALREKGKQVVVLAFEEDAVQGDYTLGSRADLSGMAHALFRHLRRADEAQADRIYAPVVPAKGWGLAIMNRLEKARSRV